MSSWISCAKFSCYDFGDQASHREKASRVRLLSLLGTDLSQLPLATLLAGLGTSLSIEDVVPPSEARGVVANELLVVKIVVVGTGPEWEELAQAPGEVVAAVGVDSLEEAEEDPGVHRQEVEVVGEGDPNNRAADNTETEKHHLDRGGVLSGETEGGAVGVVHLVDGPVEGSVVQRAVEPVVPGVLHDEKDADLHGHLPEGRKGNAILKTKVDSDGMEEPDLGELDGAVLEEDEGGAFPLFSGGGNFLLFSSRSAIRCRVLTWGYGCVVH